MTESGELPIHWSQKKNVKWKTLIPGEGASSPILWGNRLFVTSSLEEGTQRIVHCFDKNSGNKIWSRTVHHDNPELTSAVTGHAASTPVTDGKRIIAFFGNAGVVCYDYSGEKLWQKSLGVFETELGLASSPVLFGKTVILLCDHDGDRFNNFDSYLIALNIRDGSQRWKIERPKLERSWSTPILVSDESETPKLMINAQDELRAYDPRNGKLIWFVKGMTPWVTPSPVYGFGLVFVGSGRNGPLLAINTAGRGDVSDTHVRWRHSNSGPYVCSPLLYGEELYVHDERGILSCYQAKTGIRHYRQRLGGKFYSSAIAANKRIYFTNEQGTTYVIRAGKSYELLAENKLDQYSVASPAASEGVLYLRTEHFIYAISE